MGLTRYQSWFRRFDGDVENVAGKPDEREFYVNTIMHHDFGEVFGSALQRIEQTSLVFLVFGSWTTFAVGFSSTGSPQWDVEIEDDGYWEKTGHSPNQQWYCGSAGPYTTKCRIKKGGEVAEIVDLSSITNDTDDVESRGAASDDSGNLYTGAQWYDSDGNGYYKYVKVDTEGSVDAITSADMPNPKRPIVFDFNNGEVLCGAEDWDNDQLYIEVRDSNLSSINSYATEYPDISVIARFDSSNRIVIAGNKKNESNSIYKVGVFQTMISDLPETNDLYIDDIATEYNGDATYVGVQVDYGDGNLYKLGSDGECEWYLTQNELNMDDGKYNGIWGLTLDPKDNVYVVISGGTYGGGGVVMVTPDGEPQWIYRNGPYDWP